MSDEYLLKRLVFGGLVSVYTRAPALLRLTFWPCVASYVLQYIANPYLNTLLQQYNTSDYPTDPLIVWLYTVRGACVKWWIVVPILSFIDGLWVVFIRRIPSHLQILPLPFQALAILLAQFVHCIDIWQRLVSLLPISRTCFSPTAIEKPTPSQARPYSPVKISSLSLSNEDALRLWGLPQLQEEIDKATKTTSASCSLLPQPLRLQKRVATRGSTARGGASLHSSYTSLNTGTKLYSDGHCDGNSDTLITRNDRLVGHEWDALDQVSVKDALRVLKDELLSGEGIGHNYVVELRDLQQQLRQLENEHRALAIENDNLETTCRRLRGELEEQYQLNHHMVEAVSEGRQNTVNLRASLANDRSQRDQEKRYHQRQKQILEQSCYHLNMQLLSLEQEVDELRQIAYGACLEVAQCSSPVQPSPAADGERTQRENAATMVRAYRLIEQQHEIETKYLRDRIAFLENDVSYIQRLADLRQLRPLPQDTQDILLEQWRTSSLDLLDGAEHVGVVSQTPSSKVSRALQ